MSNTLQPPVHVTAGSDKQSTRIDLVENMAQQIHRGVSEIENRLHAIVERLDGPRPPESVPELPADQPGIFGSIDGRQSQTRMDIDRCVAWLDEIEQLV
jgi:hypothetical protein